MSEYREELSNELVASMFIVFRSLRGEVSKVFEEFIPMNEFFVLRILNREKQEKVSKIAQELHVSSSHITAVSEKLIARDLLERTRCSTDRRVVFLKITEQGSKLVREMEERKTKYIKEKFATLSEEEMKIAIDVFQKLAKS
ncbi:MarR family winged helix-turn-helix transcriptional regulator [Ectobacillus polymachus]|uniref:MarR family winged helix-turn-helix transcriptional regulator n=1 Tax=Ectobacillus polymachus TaxID=1508806 RepID=UPI003A88D2AC